MKITVIGYSPAGYQVRLEFEREDEVHSFGEFDDKIVANYGLTPRPPKVGDHVAATNEVPRLFVDGYKLRIFPPYLRGRAGLDEIEAVIKQIAGSFTIRDNQIKAEPAHKAGWDGAHYIVEASLLAKVQAHPYFKHYTLVDKKDYVSAVPRDDEELLKRCMAFAKNIGGGFTPANFYDANFQTELNAITKDGHVNVGLMKELITRVRQSR